MVNNILVIGVIVENGESFFLLLKADQHFCHCRQCQINSTYPLFVQGHFGKNIDEYFFMKFKLTGIPL
jgi:hypothetical protein